jgi:flagellar biosynthesis protein FliR
MAGSRSAIAAVIIIMLHDIETNQTDYWSITIARIVSVVVGCAIGLIVTLIFHRKISTGNKVTGKTDEG